MDTSIRSGNKYPVYWGSAQWSITGKFAEYIVDFYDNNPEFNKWFCYAFPSDELYFATVIHNSEYGGKTRMNGAENVKKGLVNWRNLHYFEYLPGRIKIFTLNDWDDIKDKDDLYIRKVNTAQSTELLDRLDKAHE